MLSSRPSRVLRTQIGDVQGKTFDFGGHQASAFLGIPYAQPPVGELRFKKPLPARPWKGVRQCTQFGSNCPYRNPTHKLTSSEDCLFLNVFVPECSKEEEPPKDLPVMFYIHGGGFMLDSSTMLGCENIARYVCKKGVIVVTINYRLGIFGFLSLDSKECPGNFGLWDMTLALQWAFCEHRGVRRRQAEHHRLWAECRFVFSLLSFPFIPRVQEPLPLTTLTLSPHSRDLFQKAMMFAGTSHCDFVNLHWDEYGREFALEFAKFHGFADNAAHSEDERNAALLVFYRKAKARDSGVGWVV
ncbi:Carboxylic ester hydrolase [Aphelenchoides fujianensis]|nr:Carboxylic ester hydrolase [Aphelenchoides fujianensis]